MAEQIWEDTFAVSLAVYGGSIVAPGGTLPIRVRIENVSARVASYTVWSQGDPDAYIWIVPPHMGLIALTKQTGGGDNLTLPMVTVKDLEPGQTIEQEAIWDVTLFQGAETFPAPNGDYELRVDFFPGEGTVDPSRAGVVLSHRVTVSGGAVLISPTTAENVAKQLQPVQWWLESHSPDNVTGVIDGVYIVNVDGVWREVTQEAYEEARATSLDPLRAFNPNTWQISFSSEYGFPPHLLTVAVDAASGDVLTTTPNLAEELDRGVVATFEASGERFSVFVANDETIEDLYRVQRGESVATILNGQLRRGEGPDLRNSPWSWHLDPTDTHMAEFTIELCDGRPSMVEADLDYWIGTIQQFCPWNATLIGIEDYRS